MFFMPAFAFAALALFVIIFLLAASSSALFPAAALAFLGLVGPGHHVALFHGLGGKGILRRGNRRGG
jgi:hypothetical protein